MSKFSPEKSIFNRLKLLWLSGVIYLITVTTVVLINWLSGSYVGELGMTVSAYVGLNGWSILIFLISNCIIVMLVFFATKDIARQTEIPMILLLVLCSALIALLGCSLFPLLADRDSFFTKAHQIFAELFFLLSTLFFIISLTSSKSQVQKRLAIGAVFYAGVYIFCYTIRLECFMQTIFIWENIFIILFGAGVGLMVNGALSVASRK